MKRGPLGTPVVVLLRGVVLVCTSGFAGAHGLTIVDGYSRLPCPFLRSPPSNAKDLSLITSLLLLHLFAATDTADSTGLDSLAPHLSADSEVVIVPRERRSVGIAIQSPHRPLSSVIEHQPGPPTLPTPVFNLGVGIRLVERGWVGIRSGIGSSYDSGLFVSLRLDLREDLGTLSHDSTVRYRTESKGVCLGLEADRGFPLLPWFSAYLQAGLAYRWEVLHASSDTLKDHWRDIHSIETRSEWESGFLVPVGIGLRLQPGRRLRILAGMEFEPSWTRARFHYSDDRQNLSGSGFHLGTSPIWAFGLDWIFTTGS